MAFLCVVAVFNLNHKDDFLIFSRSHQLPIDVNIEFFYKGRTDVTVRRVKTTPTGAYARSTTLQTCSIASLSPDSLSITI